MNLIKAQLLSETNLSEARRFHTVLHSIELINVYENVDGTNHAAILEFSKLVKEGRYDGLRRWIKKYKERELSEHSVRELRQKASSMGIEKHYLMTKVELLQYIRHFNKTKGL